MTATDISERALAFTRFNLLLNAFALNLDAANLEERVSLRLGSLLEPVAGETFDLVVSNPPFVITPRSDHESPEDQFTYRDGGMAGDGIVSTLVQQLPTVLALGGRAQMLGNWEIPVDGQDGPVDWADRPRAWVGRRPKLGLSSARYLNQNSTPKPGCATPAKTAIPPTLKPPTPPTCTTSPPAALAPSGLA